MNAISVIEPYRYKGMWVFDASNWGITKEPFVAGADTIIDRALERKEIDGTEGFKLTFSDKWFPDFDFKFEKVDRASVAGVWYYSKDFQMEAWLCDVLFKFFKEAPEEIYTKFDQLEKESWLKRIFKLRR